MKKLWSTLLNTLMLFVMTVSVAFAADGEAVIDTGDTAWVLISAALVFIMTPGLGFFYGGMVRNKNVLNWLYINFWT